MPRLRVVRVPERIAVPQLARTYRREVLEVDGVLLLRHEEWVARDWAGSRLFPWRFSPVGKRHELVRLPDPGRPRIRCALEDVVLQELSHLLRR